MVYDEFQKVFGLVRIEYHCTSTSAAQSPFRNNRVVFYGVEGIVEVMRASLMATCAGLGVYTLEGLSRDPCRGSGSGMPSTALKHQFVLQHCCQYPEEAKTLQATSLRGSRLPTPRLRLRCKAIA